MQSKFLLVPLVISVLLISGCAQQEPAKTGATGKRVVSGGSGEAPTSPITVSDQAVKDRAVTISKISSPVNGWIVVHAEQEGRPGAVIGQAQVKQGENSNIAVEIDQAKATDTLYAMLHKDAGKAGVFEFPGPDVQVTVGDVAPEVAVSSFKLKK